MRIIFSDCLGFGFMNVTLLKTVFPPSTCHRFLLHYLCPPVIFISIVVVIVQCIQGRRACCLWLHCHHRYIPQLRYFHFFLLKYFYIMKCKNTCVKMLDFTIKRKVQKWSEKCKNTYVKNVGFLLKTHQIMQRLINQIWEASPKSDQGSARRDWPQVWSGWTSLPRSPSSWLPIFSSPLPHCPLIMFPCHNPCFRLFYDFCLEWLLKTHDFLSFWLKKETSVPFPTSIEITLYTYLSTLLLGCDPP